MNCVRCGSYRCMEMNNNTMYCLDCGNEFKSGRCL